MSEDSKSDKKVYILVERASRLSRGVSRALWPARARRFVETSKAAQRRRARLMRQRSSLPPKLRSTQWLSRLFLAALVASSMLSGGTLVLAVLWHLWFLPLCAAFALALSLLALRPRWPANLPSVPLSQQMIMDSSLPASSSAGLPWKSLPGQPGAPETPMPDPPSLVRVLETFDLSRGELEPALTELPWPSMPPSASGARCEWGERHSFSKPTQAPLADELPCSSAGTPTGWEPALSPLVAPSPPLVGPTSNPGQAGIQAWPESLEQDLQAQPPRSASSVGRPTEIPKTQPRHGAESGETTEVARSCSLTELENQQGESEQL
ncbi:MAG: hypothetical protein IRZ24_19110 [Thermogemmatispora sp.]|uniref:hypothetical protein n=1 Tax=Thermogemmatispora sp. TaxID=1968838 RepID=UPI001DC21749|nr:hypothetical protein [Thermogemmatispora sp.]MBX5452181.1 hypothetical protein [Thermogemmatispora sp.]